MDSIKKNLLWNSISTFGRIGISFIATILLARLLTPNDYGVWGIIYIFISISELLVDSGMGGYLIKKNNLTDLDYNTLFVFNLGISILLYVLIFLIAPIIAKFYDKPEVSLAIRIAGLAIVFAALGITPYNKLLKHLQFKQLALVSVFAGIMSLVIATFMAIKHYGYWALIVQHITSTLAVSLGVYYFSRHIPQLKFNFSIFKEQFNFGINLMGGNILNSLTSNISNNIIGKVFNLSLTGLYVQASKLQTLSVSSLTSIIDKTFFPQFSKINDNKVLLYEQHVHLSRGMYALCFPLFTIVIIFSNLIVKLLLGDQWIECVPMLRVLMLISFPSLARAMNRNLLKSLGFTNSIFRIDLLSSLLLFLLLVIAIKLDNFWGIIYSMVLMQLFAYIISVYYVVKKCGINAKRQLINFIIFLPVIIVPLVVAIIFNYSELFCLIALLGVLYVLKSLNVPEYNISLKSIWRK